MNTPPYASAAAKLLRRFLPNEQAIGADRERGIATLERAMRSRARRRRLRWLGAALVAAASLWLVVGVAPWARVSDGVLGQVSIQGSPTGRGAALRTGELARPLAERAELAAGQRLETPHAGGASLELSTGTSLHLSDSSSFRVDSQGITEHFTLERGQLSAHVAKLTLGQRFIVATPDAEIEVRGTRFRIRVLDVAEACGSGTRTRLDVNEGVVEVRASGKVTSVSAGQHWPTDCIRLSAEATPAKSNAPLESPVVAPARMHESPLAPLGRREPESPGGRPNKEGSMPRVDEPNSALTEMNDMFAEGVALRRKGDSEGALGAYQALIVRFPSSPLAENARVERMRVLAAKRDPGARREAELYLSRYPKGFAASEAHALTVAP